MDSVALAREREAKARELLRVASQNPAEDVCDDAWMTAAIFQTLLDDLRRTSTVQAAVEEAANRVAALPLFEDDVRTYAGVAESMRRRAILAVMEGH